MLRLSDEQWGRMREHFPEEAGLAHPGPRKGGRYHAEAAMRLWTAIGTEIWAEIFLDRGGEPVIESGAQAGNVEHRLFNAAGSVGA